MMHFSSSSFCLLLVVFFMCESDVSAQANPLNTAALSGEIVTLNCKRPSMNVAWWFTNVEGTISLMIVSDCQVLPEFTSQYTVDTIDGACNLIVFNAQLSHAGTYACQETSTPNARRSAELTILNGVQQCLPSVNPVVYGQTVTITCDLSYSGNWPPAIRWVDRYGQTVTNDTTVTTSSNVKSYIQIPSFFPSVPSFTSVSYFNELILPNITGIFRANNTPSNIYVVPTQVVDVVCPAPFWKTAHYHCYAMIEELLDWPTSQFRCQQLYPGAYFIVISDASEQTDVLNYFIEAGIAVPGGYIWISGYATEGCWNFAWNPLPGYFLPMNYTNWAPDQPFCYGGWEPSVAMESLSSLWNDAGSNITYFPLCEFELEPK